MLNKLYEEGKEKLFAEFSVEKLIRSQREVRLMAEAMNYLNKTTRVAIITFPETVIDLDEE